MLDKSVSMLRLDEGLEVSALRDCFASFCLVIGLLVLTDSFKESFAVWVLLAIRGGVLEDVLGLEDVLEDTF